MMRWFLGFCLLLLTTVSVQAAPFLSEKDAYTLQYGVYAGGFRALTIETQYDLSPQTYGIEMRALPYGVIGKLLPWAGTYTTKGKVAGGTGAKLLPDSHVKISRWAEDNDQDYFTYQNGQLTGQQRVSVDKGKEQKYPVAIDSVFSKNAVDIPTAVLQMLRDMAMAGKKPSCDSSTEVFDGKRRFRLQFRDKGIETLQASDYNIYSGKAELCEVELVPLQGFEGKKRGYYKIQEDARAAGQLPRVWLAPLWEGGPVLPVRMLVKSEYGAVLAHIQKVTR